MFGAQFDDAATGKTLVLEEPLEIISAVSLAEVVPALEAVAAASRDGHWVGGYVSYDAAPAFDSSFAVPGSPEGPYAWFGVFGDCSEVPYVTPEASSPPPYSISRWIPAVDRREYEGAFKVVRDHIREGDTYQVNLTFPLHAAFSGESSHLYGDLMRAQHSRFGARIWHDNVSVLSASPEQFFNISGTRITTRPMKGTRPRGRWHAEDVAFSEDLAESEKDRAENLMIVDLIRNDLGMVAEFGSVHVDELFAIEQYPTVWQMTSAVSADLRDGVELVDVFGALFPCGSVTGAPKARSTQIIADVEPHSRGVYCGAVGFVPPGSGLAGASFNVAIRTAVLNDAEGYIVYGVGGGVTWDSDVGGEYAEALAKSLVLTATDRPDGVLESIRWDGEYLWLEDHLDRLESSAAFLGIEVHVPAVRAALDALEPMLSEPTKVRVAVDASGSSSVRTDEAPQRFGLRPGPDGGAVTVAIDFDPIDSRDPVWFHKTTDRKRYTKRRRRHPGADEVLLTNEHGHVTEGTISNVAALIDDEWITPPLSDGLLPGVMRAHLLTDGVVSEGSIHASELAEAQAIAVFNSVRGWRSAVLATD